MEKNPQIKGLLVYHYLGTGKTYLALGYAERNPRKKIILLVPRFLKGQWLRNMSNYGVKNRKRYTIITHREAKKLLNLDLSNTIVIIDESHKIIAKLHSGDLKINDVYSNVYLDIQHKAHRVLSLTGTPIYTDMTDIAYQINLVSGKEILPFNKKDFRTKFTKISQHKSAFIGYVAESKASPFIFGLTAWGIAGTLLPGVTILPAIAVGYFSPWAIKTMLPVKTNPLRSFNVENLEHISNEYITYYGIQKDNKKYYPAKKIEYNNTSYNNFQTDFLIRFADSQLTTKEVMQLQRDQDISYGKNYVSLNSTLIQDKMKNNPQAGLEIGNLLHLDPKSKKVIYPYKFVELLNIASETDGAVVVYSHFYHNGILLLKKYLEAMGYKGKYALLHPGLDVKDSENIIAKYNNGKLKFLLLHPEITEGISLKGTQQLHILETPFNKSIQEQVIGRAVRYQSHSHLPENKRLVNVYIWRPTFSMLNIPHNVAIRNNWQRNFLELNYYGERTLVDPNNEMKSFTPDDLSYEQMRTRDNSMKELVEFLQKHSIEKK
ncbi:MAG: hypothetical protein HRT87_07235 [Legionellales bacterium]|nr:hypothetical protein [Legionellales bacterium]